MCVVGGGELLPPSEEHVSLSSFVIYLVKQSLLLATRGRSNFGGSVYSAYTDPDSGGQSRARILVGRIFCSGCDANYLGTPYKKGIET